MKLLKCIWSLLVPLVMFSSCSDEPEPEPESGRRLILIYAVAANSLQGDLRNDTREILSVAPQLDLKHNVVLMYSVDYSNECKLQILEQNPETKKYQFTTIQEFPELPLSTSPQRIREVMDYVNDNYIEYEKKGLVLWSHATGWLPAPNGDTPAMTYEESRRKSFGSDKYPNSNSPSYETNINLLSEAIPEGMFDFIWFDCCYMANIETVYQLRNHADYIVGYVEEIGAAGMPYDKTMPYLLQGDANLVGAAMMVYDYYDRAGMSAPVSIMATENLENLAKVASDIFHTGEAPADLSYIQNYTRSWLTKDGIYFYDMKQLLESYSGLDAAMVAELNAAMDNVVVFKVFSDYPVPGPQIEAEHYSGLSMHNFKDNGSFNNNFYKELDWYKATR